MDLSKPFIVIKGQSYAIVVTQKTSDKKYAVNVQASNNPDVKGIVNKGESFILMDGKWQDYSSKKLKKDLLKKVTGEPDVPEDRRISGEIPHQRQEGLED